MTACNWRRHTAFEIGVYLSARQQQKHVAYQAMLDREGVQVAFQRTPTYELSDEARS